MFFLTIIIFEQNGCAIIMSFFINKFQKVTNWFTKICTSIKIVI